MTKKASISVLIIPYLLVILSCHSKKFVLPESLQQHREKRLAQFEQENKQLYQQNYIILLGNSLTEGFPMDTYFADQPVLNRGIVADHTGIEGIGILQRLKESVFDCRASSVFLLIGVNDLADRIYTPKQIARGVKLIVQKIHQFNPQIKIYFQSALPTTGKYTYLNSMVLEYNQHLQKISNDLKLTYIDPHPHFKNQSGELYAHYTRDGIHLNDEGYKTWYHLILPYFGF